MPREDRSPRIKIQQKQSYKLVIDREVGDFPESIRRNEHGSAPVPLVLRGHAHEDFNIGCHEAINGADSPPLA